MAGQLYEVFGQLRFANAPKCPAALKGQPVHLKSKDNAPFEIPAETACVSGKLRSIIIAEGTSGEIALPLSKDVLGKAIEWMKYHTDTPSGEIRTPIESSNIVECGATKWDAAFVKVDKDKLFDLLLASSLLEISSLFLTASAQAAATMKDRESMKLRKEYNMNNDFTADEEESLKGLTLESKKKKKMQIDEENTEELAKSAAMIAGFAAAADKQGVGISESKASVKSWKMANWRAAVMLDWKLLGSAPEEVRGDKELVLAALMSSIGLALKYATDALKQDKELILEAVKCGGSSFGNAATPLRGDKGFVHEAADIKGEAMTGATTDLRGDTGFLMELLGGPGEGTPMQGATEQLLSDRDFVLKALEKDPETLKYAAKELLVNRDFLIQAAATNGLSLQFMPPAFKADADIVALAVRENPKAAAHAHPARRTEMGVAQAYDTLHKISEDDISALGTVVNLVQGPRIQNIIEPGTVNNPWILKATKMVQFTAGSTMTANMGQGNYVAANSFLDKLPAYERPLCDSVSLMWGAVGNIGMRWKAFASADFLNATPEALLSVNDCAKILVATCVWVDAPEWYNCQHYDGFTREAILRPTANFGQGGGYKPGEAALPPAPPRNSSRRGPLGKEKGDAPLGGWPGLMSFEEEPPAPPPVMEGTRVRLVGVGAKDGKKGYALKEVEGGRWKVWLDQGGGNAILKIENLEVIDGQEPQAAPAPALDSGRQRYTLPVDPAKTMAPLGPQAQQEQPEEYSGSKKRAEEEQKEKAQAWWRAQLGGFDNVIDALASVQGQVVETAPPKADPAPSSLHCD